MPTVGRSIPHDSARGHVTGQAAFIDDYVPRSDELLVEFVGSPVACGTVQSIEVQQAARIPGVVAIFTARDLPGQNHFGVIYSDEPFLADTEVQYVGQPLVVIAGVTREACLAAREAVRINVQPRTAVFSIDDARRAQQFIGPPRQICRGDFRRAWEKAPHRLEGTFESGGQEQFYLESQAAIAYPDDDGRLAVHSSTQNPSEVQQVVAEALGLGLHEVVCVCKRMGGAFGGKETQSSILAVMVALVAHHTGRSARMILTKDDDMRITGKRHPYQTDYRVGFDDEGRLLAVQFDFFSNGGAFADLSTSVLERTMLHAENAYYIPDVEINARICRTNLPPNTAFRGFGGPQGMAVIENAIQEIAHVLGRDAYDVRRLNCYGVEDRNVTPYGQVVHGNRLPEVFDQLVESSCYRQRMLEVDAFNQTSATHLRGLAMTPVKFGISFTTKFLNQGNALVHLYTDGSVQVSTGATEMGQGVNTKIRQLVADELGIRIESVRVMETSTEKNNNTSPSAASATTDLNGTAAVRASRQIRERLARFAAEQFADSERGLIPSVENIRFANGEVTDRRIPNRRLTFAELAGAARRERIDLGARGFYATPGVDFNRETGQGNPFYYFTTGCAVAEVQIDRFTGDLTVRRVDMLMDIGQSINPGIDRGQVIGGFVQGMGYVTAEELKYDEAGALLSYSPTTYKIPNITDVPRDFHVDFITNHENARNLRASKAVGEPPLMLALSVWAAVKHALCSAAADHPVPLRIPATNEEILTHLSRQTQRSPKV